MISILAVGAGEKDVEEMEARHPSVEVLAAHRVEDTLEKLGRNRRIDAVLLLSADGAREIVAAIEEDNPAHPPLFQPTGGSRIPAVRTLAATEPGHLIDLLLAELES